MKIALKKQWPFWLGMTVLILVFLYLVKAILLPFVVGIMVAYFLDPVADKLERTGLSRGLSTLFITSVFFLLLLGALSILLPLVYQQLEVLINTLPDLISEHQKRLFPQVNGWLHRLDPELAQRLTEALKNASVTILGWAVDFISGVMQSSLAVVNLLSLLFVTPVVAFYFLRDWDKMVARLHRLIPRKHLKTVKQQLALIDATLAGFIRGQTQVCLLLGIFYAIALSAVGLKGGALIGFLTGIASFVPYVGMLLGTVIGLIVAWFQFGAWQGVLVVAAVFAVGQVVEGNFVAPKLVGDKVGLHPVWLIFGMLAGGALFGFLGVVVAVPITAVLGVVTRFLMIHYLESNYYKK